MVLLLLILQNLFHCQRFASCSLGGPKHTYQVLVFQQWMSTFHASQIALLLLVSVCCSIQSQRKVRGAVERALFSRLPFYPVPVALERPDSMVARKMPFRSAPPATHLIVPWYCYNWFFVQLTITFLQQPLSKLSALGQGLVVALVWSCHIHLIYWGENVGATFLLLL